MLASLGGELNLMAKLLINGSNLVLAIGPFFLIGVLAGVGLSSSGVSLKRWFGGRQIRIANTTFWTNFVFVGNVSTCQFTFYLNLEWNRAY